MQKVFGLLTKFSNIGGRQMKLSPKTVLLSASIFFVALIIGQNSPIPGSIMSPFTVSDANVGIGDTAPTATPTIGIGNTSPTFTPTPGPTSTPTPTPTPVPDSTAPTATITNPQDQSTVSGQVQIRADATDNVGVTKVEFLVDNNLLGVGNSAPYMAIWNTIVYPHNSVHTILARAYDAVGNIGTSPVVTVTVLDIIPPTVAVTNPANGSTVVKRSTVTITANASDISGISKVEFFVNGVLKCTDTGSPYACAWQVPNKPNVQYTIWARAFDAANNNTTSPTITVTSK